MSPHAEPPRPIRCRHSGPANGAWETVEMVGFETEPVTAIERCDRTIIALAAAYALTEAPPPVRRPAGKWAKLPGALSTPRRLRGNSLRRPSPVRGLGRWLDRRRPAAKWLLR